MEQISSDEDRYYREVDYFECGCDIHISVPDEQCSLHKRNRMPHGKQPKEKQITTLEDIFPRKKND